MYSKRKGTSGICGQLYESKLISLLYFRALRDTRIEDFQLASNVDNIGAFDDIYFKATVKGLDKPVLVFIQAKHKENENQTLKNDLVKYFQSYLKIRYIFETKNNNLLLEGSFEETHYLFVIYTTARDEFVNNSEIESCFSSNLNDLIGTPRGTAKQPYKNETNIEFLTKIIVKEQLISLAERIAKLILGEENPQMMLTDHLVMRYHVILCQNVFEVSDIKSNGHRIAFFRNEFFDTSEEYLGLFKDILFRAILKKRKIKQDDIKSLVSEFLKSPDAIRLSKLIETVITYKNGRLEIVERYTKNIDHPLDQVSISQWIVNVAVALAVKDMVSSRKFIVPAAFGNKDLTLNGSDAKREGRIKHLSSKIIDLLHKCDSSKVVTIDDSIEKGLLQLNGGLAGAVGNILVLDNETKLMKVTNNSDLLGDYAKQLYKKINNECHNLHEYKFCFNVYKFPKLSFDCSKFEKNIARDFLKKLLFYSNQADENGLELILKSEIECYQRGFPNHFKAKTDAIFAKYHDDIQNWWKQPNQAMFLTREPDLFQNAINNIIRDPLMSSLNITYMSKIKQCNYTFSEEAVNSLNLQNRLSSTLIIMTENNVLTVLKVLQHFENNEHLILDIEYIINLPESDRNALYTELTNINEDKVLIFMFKLIQNSRNENENIDIAKAIHKMKTKNKTIVITNEVSVKILKKYFPEADITYDEKTGLIDMSHESQKSILENTTVLFQDKTVPLNVIINDESIANVTGTILNKIINEETIKVGKLTVNRNYDEIKHLYVDRRVTFTRYDHSVFVQTLYDLTDDVVLVTAEPGMGKSTLLSNLSLRTKEVHPETWIVRINLLEYSKQFSQWKEAKTAINILETLKFMCQVIIKDKFIKENNVEIMVEEKNNVVYLKHCTGDEWMEFELKLFLHFYNKRKVIFLFDGFDEICPHYVNEVIKCLKSIKSDARKQRIWITSRSYNEIKIILQQEFGSSYNIDYYLYAETEEYLKKYFDFHLRFEELNTAQLDNVEKFLKYMVQGKDVTVLSEALPQRPLHRVYNSASKYLLHKILHMNIPSWSHSLTNMDIKDIKSTNDLFTSIYSKSKSDRDEDNRCGKPLYMFLAAYYFVENIKNYNMEIKGWDLENNLFTFYEWFLETTIKKQYQEKNKMDMYNPDIISAYEKDLVDSILKHKKLAAYAIFNLEKNRKLFSMNDLEEIEEWMKFIEKGGEKRGIIYSVANGIPIFIHMTFTEYFAVEYICDCLKNEKDREMVEIWIDFIIHVFFSNSYSLSLQNMLDSKIDLDKTLISILNKYNNVRFNSLMKAISNSKFLRPVDYSHSFPIYSLRIYMSDYSNTLHCMKQISYTVNEKNLEKFLKIVYKTKLLPNAIGNGYSKLAIFVFDLVREYDKSKLKPMLRQNFSHLSRTMHYDKMTSKQILEHIYEGFKEEYCETGHSCTIA
ncbi:hypothetical protein PYW07_000838 [Mythimna separata]|uniref:Nephrocystin 3-like N-terminal domain-containing protein n=1 Tax=Mythimna separata TaxID=271217 RepID=A0AAD7YT55_MYTSE|nr:hypothetical protein PYW07_000838 [Mythimna separata]